MELDELKEDTTPAETTDVPAKKTASKKLVCVSAQKIAWDNEQVVLENEDAKVTLHLKNPKLHGKHVVGKSYNAIG